MHKELVLELHATFLTKVADRNALIYHIGTPHFLLQHRPHFAQAPNDTWTK